MLLKHFNQIKKMVLWAPAIGYTAENSLPPLIHLPLKNIISIFDIKTTPSLLRNIATPTLLLRGETDAIVVKENLILVKNSMPRASLQEIANMDTRQNLKSN
jgi:alpha-beta hydrolase superfamily lysophospholipase